MGFDPYAYLAAFPAAAIDELHLGGFTPEEDDATPGATLLDRHARDAYCDDVWPLYRDSDRAIRHPPNLIEWDADLPLLPVLSAEAARADAIARR